MELVELADVELTYTSLAMVDYGAGRGGQIYGEMAGRSTGRLSGGLTLTNLAGRRPDNVNIPTLRGLLETADGARVWLELDGIATLRPADGARVFVTSCRFRTGDDRYRWLNEVLGVLEGVLGAVEVGGTARGRLFECRATVE